MTQLDLSGMVWNVSQRCGRAAACSAEAAGAGLHRRGGRGEAAAVPRLGPLYLTGGCKSPIANSPNVPETASRLGLKDFGTAQQKM